MGKKKIWVKLFRLEGRYYCYDVVSNNIMEIDELLYNILKNYNYSNQVEMVRRFEKDYAVEKITQAIETIHIFNKERGGFGLRKKIKLRFPFTRVQYKLALKNLVNHMVLNITEKCNFKCGYCKFSGIYPNARRHSSKSMDFGIIKQSIDFLVENASYIINETDRDLVLGFYGGEPLQESKMIVEALRYLEKEYKNVLPRFRFSITTNGSLLDEEIIKTLVRYNFTLLISLNGPQRINDRYRVFHNGKGSYNAILEKIELIKKVAPDYFERKVGFSTVLVPKFHFKEVIDYFRNVYRGKNRVYLFSLMDDSDTDFFKSFDMASEWKEYKKDKTQLKKEYKIAKMNDDNDAVLNLLFDSNISDIHNRKIQAIPDELFPNGICLPGLQKVFVDTDGHFHMCEKINWKFNIGNINEGFDIDKIFFYIEEYIRVTDNCKYCWAVRLCKECYLSALKGDTFSRDEKKMNCRYKKKKILEYIKDYVSISEKKPEAFDENEEETKNIASEVFAFLQSIDDHNDHLELFGER